MPNDNDRRFCSCGLADGRGCSTQFRFEDLDEWGQQRAAQDDPSLQEKLSAESRQRVFLAGVLEAAGLDPEDVDTFEYNEEHDDWMTEDDVHTQWDEEDLAEEQRFRREISAALGGVFSALAEDFQASRPVGPSALDILAELRAERETVTLRERVLLAR